MLILSTLVVENIGVWISDAMGLILSTLVREEEMNPDGSTDDGCPVESGEVQRN